jgi:creatinine amidohydrolase
MADPESDTGNALGASDLKGGAGAEPGRVIPEVRYERLHPAEMRAAVERLNLAYVPLGPLEFHGEHLPLGVDAFEAHGLCVRAAQAGGGVVLPPAYIASGCLDLPFTIDYDLVFVHAWAMATLGQLARRGFMTAVVVTGHGPLDLNHLLKRACREVSDASPGFRATALCWLELNAARLTAPETGEPTTVDHAARVETSWMMALQPGLVRVERLADDPAARHVGVYGPNPRFTASAAFGTEQIAAASALLAKRAGDLAAGKYGDPLDDLRTFVRYSWPEAPVLSGAVGDAVTRLLLTNPGRASRYLSSLSVEIDGTAIERADMALVNSSVGESGVAVAAERLDAEHGFYVRREQTAEIVISGLTLQPGPHHVRAELGLGGVTALMLDEHVEFAST